MEIILFENNKYLKFQSEGNASQFAIPFAKKICKGIGYDIGYYKDEWKLPGAIGIDIEDKSNSFDANNLPNDIVDFIYSSHCLEHIHNWVETVEYWLSKIKEGGILFLYLPDISQNYWNPWNNKKHIHCFFPEIFNKFCISKKFKNYFVSGVDLNNSFYVVIEKCYN